MLPNEPVSTPKRQTRTGRRTRHDILRMAVDIASAEGLEGLTIGRLAKELNMSKSGLFAHFGSKEELQIATVETARDIFIEEIIDPAAGTERGIERLRVLLEFWLSYVERSVFRGGCFFAAASLEFDSREGPVRTLIAALTKAWLDLLIDEFEQARKKEQIGPSAEANQVVFELHALVQEANWAFHLLQDNKAFERARTGITNRLNSLTYTY